ncbi:unnamed protein product, partial [Ectocarpus sp. 12 AP-2014]
AGGTVRGVKHGGGENGTPPPPPPEGQGTTGASLIELDGEGHGEGWAVPAADEESGVLRGEFENL